MSDLDLARRAVACPKWRWMRGMTARYHDGSTRPSVFLSDDDFYDTEYACLGYPEDYDPGGECEAGAPLLPDLSDPATLGCLLALVREAWGEPSLIAAMWDDPTWRVWDWCRNGLIGSPRRLGEGIGEAGALVAALEAAP